jgi:hypothetical protein
VDHFARRDRDADMTNLTGAVVLLAAAVLFAGGAIAEAILEAGKASRSPVGMLSMGGGALLGIIGLGMLFTSSRPGPPNRGEG